MKDKSKSARKDALALFFLPLCLLSSCADVSAPTWLTGEPGKDVLTAPRVVGSPQQSVTKAWPNLADVPEKKPVFTDERIRSGRAEDMESDRLKAQAEMERLRNIELGGANAADEGMPKLPFTFSSQRPDEVK